MRSLNAASLYPGLCLLEYSKNLSMGRGTDAPFEQMGADFIEGPKLAAYLNKKDIPGLRIYPTSFTPTESKFKDVHIKGIRFVITARERFDPIRLGLELAAALQHLYPGKVDFEANRLLLGNQDVIRRLSAGQSAVEVMDSYRAGLRSFEKLRAKYLLY